MNAKAGPQAESTDVLKWGLVVILVASGIVANYYFSEYAWSLRLAAWIVLAIIAGAIALRTNKGRNILEFAKESRVELRKVVWPTRHETVQSTAIVAVMVLIMGLLLWAVDSLLMWVVAHFTI